MTKADIIGLVLRVTEEQRESSEIPGKVAGILAKWEGKALNKRIVDQLEEVLPGWLVSWYPDRYYTSSELTIWQRNGQGLPDRKKEWGFTVRDRQHFNLADFRTKDNARYYDAAEERNRARDELGTHIDWLSDYAEALLALWSAEARYKAVMEQAPQLPDSHAMNEALAKAREA